MTRQINIGSVFNLSAHAAPQVAHFIYIYICIYNSLRFCSLENLIATTNCLLTVCSQDPLVVRKTWSDAYPTVDHFECLNPVNSQAPILYVLKRQPFGTICGLTRLCHVSPRLDFCQMKELAATRDVDSNSCNTCDYPVAQ
jgi:hypothetical protein